MTLGANLKKYRKAQKLSQREVAEKSEIHTISYYRFEKDKLLPTADTLKKLSLALKVSLDDLIFTEEEKNSIRVSNKALLERLDRIDELSKKDRDSLIHLLDALLPKRKLSEKH